MKWTWTSLHAGKHEREYALKQQEKRTGRAFYPPQISKGAIGRGAGRCLFIFTRVCVSRVCVCLVCVSRVCVSRVCVSFALERREGSLNRSPRRGVCTHRVVHSVRDVIGGAGG